MNNSNLSIFNFESNEVRVLYINDEPVFCLVDILFAYKSATEPNDAVKSISDYLGNEFIFRVDYPELKLKKEEEIFINQPAVTFLLSRSRTKLGKSLNRWIHNEILPTLRKEGTYSIKPMSPAELIIAQGQAMLALEQKQAQLEAEQARLAQVVALEAQRTSDIEALVIQHDAELDRVFNPNGHYFSVMGYCSLKGKPVSVKQAAVYGRKASKYCKQNNIQIEPVTDPRFGKVNTYPEQVLAQII